MQIAYLESKAYKITEPNYSPCTIIITYQNRITIVSAYGCWSTYFSAPGDCFYKFLCEVNMHYMSDRMEEKTRPSVKFKKFWEIYWNTFINEVCKKEQLKEKL